MSGHIFNLNDNPYGEGVLYLFSFGGDGSIHAECVLYLFNFGGDGSIHANVVSGKRVWNSVYRFCGH